MNRRFAVAAAVCLLVVAVTDSAAAQSAPAVAPSPAAVIPRGQESKIQALLADVGVDTPLPGGVIFDSTRVFADRVVFQLRTVSGAAVVSELIVRHRTTAPPGAVVTRGLSIVVAGDKLAHKSVLDRALQSIKRQDQDDIFKVLTAPNAIRVPPVTADWKWVATALLLALLILLTALLQWPPRTWRHRIRFHFKPTHALPGVIQVLLFSYWSLYFRDLGHYLPLIALELVYAFVLAAALDLHRTGRWTASFGPVPITLSTNLFVLFVQGDAYLTVMAISVALLSQRLIRRGGSHVLNPSSFGVATVGLLTLVLPTLGYGDSAYEFSLAPNMSEVVVLLALIVQFRVPVVLISAAAMAGLLGMGFVLGRVSFSPYWAPVLLVIVLLATDPRTSPRRPLAQLLYGFAVGVFMRLSGGVLEALFDHDFYGKVVGVAAANVLVPWFDSLAERSPWQPKLLERKFNPLHVALWFALITMGLTSPGTKAGNLAHCDGCQALHHDNRTPFVNFGPGRTVPCAQNQLYCAPFTFAKELACWRTEWTGTGKRCGSGKPAARRSSHGPRTDDKSRRRGEQP
ncbi:MAG: hypothetical protein KC502_02330 [Myxococcales bacterium]|nr:hypothetical protein [Myxococcales bacterium]